MRNPHTGLTDADAIYWSVTFTAPLHRYLGAPRLPKPPAAAGSCPTP